MPFAWPPSALKDGARAVTNPAAPADRRSRDRQTSSHWHGLARRPPRASPHSRPGQRYQNRVVVRCGDLGAGMIERNERSENPGYRG